jgi:hypothetical protein
VLAVSGVLTVMGFDAWAAAGICLGGAALFLGLAYGRRTGR